MLAESLFQILDDIASPSSTSSVSGHRRKKIRPASEAYIRTLPTVKFQAPPSLASVDTDVGASGVQADQDKGKHQVTGETPTCYICLERYVNGDEIRILPCKHSFHANCVDQWLTEVRWLCCFDNEERFPLYSFFFFLPSCAYTNIAYDVSIYARATPRIHQSLLCAYFLLTSSLVWISFRYLMHTHHHSHTGPSSMSSVST